MNIDLRFPSSRAVRHLRELLIATAIGAVFATSHPARAVSEPSALNGQKKSYAYSWEQELKEGAEADKEITQQMGLYDNPQVQAYVEGVGRKVLQASTFADASTPEMYRNTRFTFRVLDNSVVNAFALPGGYVYVTRGLLSHVDNEAQLAVVLGHEIAHVAARHSSQQARRSQWSQLGVIAGAILGQAVLGDRMPNLAENVLNTGSQAMQVFLLRYSREAENEADTFGVRYAVNAGYAAEESARFFDALRRLSATEGKGMPTWMSSHPDPGNRADHVVQLANERRPNPQVQRIVGTEQYLRAIDGMILGDDPRQGFTQNGVFYHPTFHFQLPVASGWKVDNQPSAVVFAEPNGRAVMGLRLATVNRTHDAAAQFVSQNKVQVSASGDTAVNGLPTTVVVGRAQTEQGQVGVWDAFIEYDGKVYSLLGYAPEQAFESMRPTFESVAAGFSPLRDARMANVQPARLRIVRAERAAPFASYVPASLPPDLTAEKVAIMNQVALNENVPQGVELKVPDASATNGPAVLATVDPAAATRPDAGAYPGRSYPSAGYPADVPETYPPTAGYPSSGYPAPGNYPQSGNPPADSTPSQAPGYPGNYPGYPSSPSYPTNSGSYPPSGSPSYPVGGSSPPPGYPSQSYPTGQTYPPAGTYPSPQSPYPANSYPGSPQAYPPRSYPPPAWPR